MCHLFSYFDTCLNILAQGSIEIGIEPRLFAEGFELYEFMDTYRIQLTTSYASDPRVTSVSYTILSLNVVRTLIVH